MDALLYLAAKENKLASIISHGDETILVCVPGGYSQRDGSPLPPVETGYQRADIRTMRDAAVKAVADAEVALEAAKAQAAAFDEVVAEVDQIVEKALAEAGATKVETAAT